VGKNIFDIVLVRTQEAVQQLLVILVLPGICHVRSSLEKRAQRGIFLGFEWGLSAFGVLGISESARIGFYLHQLP
jgi:hypothetical protein